MDLELIVPEGLQYIFRRMLNYVPEELRDDVSLQKMLLLYFKIGGENLARQHIEITKIRLEEKNKVPQHPLERICPDDVELDDDDDDDVDFD